jgi:glycosyltransferase involved in cell wall biosynthesis
MTKTMAKLKVAQVRWCEPTGGVERVLRDIARYADTSRFDIRFFFLARGGPFMEEIQHLGYRVELIPASRGYDMGLRLNLARRLWQFRPDVVHEHGIPPLVRPILRWSTGAPLLGFEHGEIAINLRKGKPWLNVLNGTEYRLFSQAVVVNSAANGALVQATHGLPPERVKVVHIGVDLDAFRPCPAASSEFPGLELGYVGRVQNYDKGVDLLPPIVEKLLAAGCENLQLRVIGDGPDLAGLQAQVAARGLSPYFEFLGARSDVAALLPQIDILIVPSRMEAFGLVSIEALAAGTSVVASDLPGIREVLAAAPDTRLVPSDDTAAFAAAAADLWRQNGRRRSAAGRTYVAANFDIRRTVADLLELYVASVRP